MHRLTSYALYLKKLLNKLQIWLWNRKENWDLYLARVLGSEDRNPRGLFTEDPQTQTQPHFEQHLQVTLPEDDNSIRRNTDRDHDAYAGIGNTEGMLAKDMLFEAHKLLTSQLPQSRNIQEAEKKEEDTSSMLA